MAAKTTSNKKGMSTAAMLAIGFGASFLLLFLANAGSDEDDAWEADESKEVEEVDSGSVDLDLDDGDEAEVPPDDPWTRGAPSGSDDDDEPEPPVDDPWTRGGPPPDDSDDEPEPPVDDPWTRGPDDDGGFGDDGFPACVGVSEFQTDVGAVVLPIDRADDAFASPDCAIPEGRSGEAVSLVQAALTVCNGQPVPLDGVYGDAMSQAVAAVQTRNGLTADGVYGPANAARRWPGRPCPTAAGARTVHRSSRRRVRTAGGHTSTTGCREPGVVTVVRDG